MDFNAIALVIPAYEPGDTLLTFLRDTDVERFAAVVVVDDGSGPGFADIFAQADVLGATVLTHPVNRGKGRALKTAFAHLQTMPGITDVITVDSDGQHHSEDVVRVADELVENRLRGRVAAVLGVRDFNGPEIPWKSRLGNRTTSIVVRLLFGRYIADTQTGLRGLPAEFLATLLSVKGERFEYEMNSLLFMLTTRKDVEELPIRTIYNDIDNSHTHFRPVRDSIQVYFQIFKFASSSLIGSAVDLAMYAAIVNLFFGGRSEAQGIIIAVVFARLVSSVVNFVVNRKLVFHDGASLAHSLARYYLLAAVLLAGSAAGSVILSQTLGGHVVWAKVIVDTILFVVSYIIQKRWVFEDNSLRLRARR